MLIGLALPVVILGSAAVFAVAGIIGNSIGEKEEREAEEERKHKPWDPALCIHEWETHDSGECENTYSSYGGGTERQTWKVLRCTHCGTRLFSCSDTSCLCHDECRGMYEDASPESGDIERELIERVADKNGFEYSHYLLRDRFGNEREAYCRVVPTTIPFSCPDCGGMVVGVDAKRVWPGSAGVEPTAYACEACGRQEDYDFGVPRVEYREGDPLFVEPKGKQPVCPQGGKHEWEALDSWTEQEWPEGVDPCTENLMFLEEVRHERLRCTKCGDEKVV